MPLPYHPVVRAVQLLGWFLLNLAIALLGTMILTFPFARVHTRTIEGILWNMWISSIAGAALLGFFMPRTMNAPGARWVWIAIAPWFIFGLLLYLDFRQHTSLLEGYDSRGWWYQFGGLDCRNGMASPGCLNYFLYTTPMIRAASYSLAAFISVRLMRKTAPRAASASSGPQ